MNTKILISTILMMSSLFLRAQTIMNIHQSNGVVLQIPLNTIDSITYTITNPGNLATLSTLPVIDITDTSATSGGNISDNGGTPVTQRGVVWGNNPNPTTANNTSFDGSGTGNFTSNLSGLLANTTYYIRTYAINSAGTAYGDELSFNTTSGVVDIVSNPGAGVTFDGYNYTSIVLGNGQEWMAENLRTTIYANGDAIPNVIADSLWLSETSGAWTFYNNDSQYEIPYGKLYNWYTVVDPRNVCPTGWHTPTDAEWTVLTSYLGGITIAGGKMKSTGTQFWQPPNVSATNEIGFSAQPAGTRIDVGYFSSLLSHGGFWSNTEVDTTHSLVRILYYNFADILVDSNAKKNGLSIRCLKD
jgi:uncharacterized protein (TIGR02145 family)